MSSEILGRNIVFVHRLAGISRGVVSNIRSPRQRTTFLKSTALVSREGAIASGGDIIVEDEERFDG